MNNMARMKGKIIAYSKDVNAGVITGENKVTYPFSRKDWIGPTEPEIDLVVDFLVEWNRAKFVK